MPPTKYSVKRGMAGFVALLALAAAACTNESRTATTSPGASAESTSSPAQCVPPDARAMPGNIDVPSRDAELSGETAEVRGWAIDRSVAATGPFGSGIDSVSLYLDGGPGVGTPLGRAAYGDRRDDVAKAWCDERFANSGWHFTWDVSTLGGDHTLYVVARSLSGVTTELSTKVRRAAPEGPVGTIEAPVEGAAVANVITVSGWAIDATSAAGTGIDTVSVYLDGDPGAGRLLGLARYGDTRLDIGQRYRDARFNGSGWQLSWDAASLPSGPHTLSAVFHARSGKDSAILSRHIVILGAGAEISRGQPTTSSSSWQGFASANAVDGVDSTVWNAGDSAPQWIEIDLQCAATIGRLRLVTEQTPAGQTTHRVYGRTPTGAAVLLHEFSGFTVDGQTLEYSPLAAWTGIRYLRVETLASPSWVAWREIGAYLAPPTPTGSMSGLVRWFTTPIPGSKVELRRGDEVVQGAVTDALGAYAFTGIPAGTYTVRAYSPSDVYNAWLESPPRRIVAGTTLKVDPLWLAKKMTLVEPVNETSVGPQVTFKWLPVDGAAIYHIDVFDEVSGRAVLRQNVNGVTFTATLPRGARYQWAVSASSDANNEYGGQIQLAYYSAGLFNIPAL